MFMADLRSAAPNLEEQRIFFTAPGRPVPTVRREGNLDARNFARSLAQLSLNF
jgi:hypothetical protein